MENTYFFDEAHHIHTLAGRPLHGVTTVLGVIAKPALIQWSADMVVSYIKNFAQPTYKTKLDIKNPPDLDKLESQEPQFWSITSRVLEEARVAHRKKKEKAGQWGTQLHAKLENYIKTGNTEDLPEKFLTWVTENNIRFLVSEKHVWSESLWFGGIVDCILMIGDKKYIGDFKTSSAIYDEAFFQIGAYDIALMEMGEHSADDIEGYIVINLKKDGGFQTKVTTDKEVMQSAFKSALALYKIIKAL